jgi:hypothetical protein
MAAFCDIALDRLFRYTNRFLKMHLASTSGTSFVVTEPLDIAYVHKAIYVLMPEMRPELP